MIGAMKRPPPYFEAENTPPTSEEGDVPEIALPDILPPNYHVLRDENGIVEKVPPKSCPCFVDPKNPDEHIRAINGLL